MELCGEVVNHKVFGTGHIIEFENNYITILFDESKTKKKFIYPTAFGAFLELENTSFTDEIEAAKTEIARQLAKNKQLEEELLKLAHPLSLKDAGAKRTRKAAPRPAY